MIRHTELISTAEAAAKVAERLRQYDVIAFDTEFIRETSFFPKFEILQLATSEESWLVDVAGFIRAAGGKRRGWGKEAGAPEQIQPILDVLQDPKILKIVHAAQGDQECLYTSLGVAATPTLDTSVAASLCGYGDGVGLGNLLKSILNVKIKKGHARTNWSVRPLPQQLADYALEDVAYLVELGQTLLSELDRYGRRDWALELSSRWEDTSMYDPDPEGIAANLARGGRLDERAYPVALELIRWRETRIRELNVPRKWLADDSVIMDLSRVRPTDLDHLQTFRGLNKGEVRKSGNELLDIIARASEQGKVKLPRTKRPRPPSGDESRSIDLLKCYVGIIADGNRLAARHLLSSDQYLPVLRSGARSADELVEQGLLSRGAAKLVGDEIIALIQGRRSLAIEGGRVKVVTVSPDDVPPQSDAPPARDK